MAAATTNSPALPPQSATPAPTNQPAAEVRTASMPDARTVGFQLIAALTRFSVDKQRGGTNAPVDEIAKKHFDVNASPHLGTTNAIEKVAAELGTSSRFTPQDREAIAKALGGTNLVSTAQELITLRANYSESVKGEPDAAARVKEFQRYLLTEDKKLTPEDAGRVLSLERVLVPFKGGEQPFLDRSDPRQHDVKVVTPVIPGATNAPTSKAPANTAQPSGDPFEIPRPASAAAPAPAAKPAPAVTAPLTGDPFDTTAGAPNASAASGAVVMPLPVGARAAGREPNRGAPASGPVLLPERDPAPAPAATRSPQRRAAIEADAQAGAGTNAPTKGRDARPAKVQPPTVEDAVKSYVEKKQANAPELGNELIKAFISLPRDPKRPQDLKPQEFAKHAGGLDREEQALAYLAYQRRGGDADSVIKLAQRAYELNDAREKDANARGFLKIDRDKHQRAVLQGLSPAEQNELIQAADTLQFGPGGALRVDARNGVSTGQSYLGGLININSDEHAPNSRRGRREGGGGSLNFGLGGVGRR